MTLPIKLFLVDGHEVFRNELKELVNGEADMEVVGEAADGETALQTLPGLRPDVIVIEVGLPGIDGMETSKLLLKHNPQTSILFFSLADNPDYVGKALEIGASGYVLKNSGNTVFLNAVRIVHRGKFYFSGEVTDVLVRRYLQQKTRAVSAGGVALSKREEQILRMIAGSQSNRAIAESLLVSIRTIEAHRLNILRKFQANNIEEVLARLDTNIDPLLVERPGKKPV